MVLAALLGLVMLSGGSFAAEAFQQNHLFSTTSWIPLATFAVLLIAAIAALVYMLSAVINSQNAKNWARIQVYEALFSIFLIMLFGALSYLFFLNPQHSFSSLNLVPPSGGGIDCTSATTLSSLATCDVAVFNSAAFSLAGAIYYVTYLTGIVPGFGVTVHPFPQDAGVSITTQLDNIVPLSDTDLLTFGFTGFLTAMLLGQLQLILLSSSLILLSIFMVLGLIARSFGFTRSFGGAMIAFGLGLGLVFPLVTALTYGFIDVHAGLPSIAGNATGFTVNAMLHAIGGLILGVGPFGFATATAIPGLNSLLLQMGFMVAGFTFIPFLNFTIVDAFIIDFSAAIGERMDFMTLLVNVI